MDANWYSYNLTKEDITMLNKWIYPMLLGAFMGCAFMLALFY